MLHDDDFTGYGELVDGALRVPIKFIQISRAKYHHTESFELELRVSEDSGTHFLSEELAHTVRFEGRTHRGKAIAIAGVRWQKASRHLMHARCDEIDFNLDEVSSEIAKQTVSAFLTPTLAAHVPFGADPIELPPPKLTWETSCGTAELRPFPESITTTHGDERGLATIWRPQVYWELEERHYTVTPRDLIESVQSELSRATKLISLLDRRHVGITGVAVVTRTKSGQIFESRRERRAQGSAATEHQSLVNLLAPNSQHFQAWLTAMDNHPAAEPLGRAIRFVVEGHRAVLIEHRVLHAFTALETIVQSLDSIDGLDLTLGKSAFAKLRRHLRGTIEEFSKQQGWSAGDAEQVVRKLPELRRASLVPRIAARVEGLAVDWKGLWPEGTELEEALTRAYQRRSRFLHTGYIDDLKLAHLDWLRILTLAERLTFACFGGRTEQLWAGGLGHLDVLEWNHES